MFVTHFSQVVNYLKHHPKVSLIQLKAEISAISQDLRFLYRATSGTVEIEDYGMKLAHKCNLPDELLESAWSCLQTIKRNQGQGALEYSGIQNSLQKRKLIFQVHISSIFFIFTTFRRLIG